MLLDMLSSYDYLGALRRIRKKRYGQTSSWLSESKVFKDWLEDANSSTLWLSGIRKIISSSALLDQKPNHYYSRFREVYCDVSYLLMTVQANF